jgi:chromosome segregation protein
LTALRTKARDEAGRRTVLSADQSTHTAALARFDAEVTAAEAELATRGGDDLGDRLVRLEALRERSRGLRAVLVERLRGIERERSTLVSQQVVVGLEAELERSELKSDELDAEAERLAPEAERLALAQTELAADRASFEMAWSEGVLPIGGYAAESRGELGVLRAAVDIGTNSALLLVARVHGDGRLDVLEDHCMTPRLGEGLWRTGGLEGEAITRTLEVLRQFAKRLERQDIPPGVERLTHWETADIPSPVID